LHTRTQRITYSALFAAVLSLSAFIRIPMGPVPLTMQSAAALTAGYCLGPRLGMASTLLYTFIGLAGVPVFASGGGPMYVLSPTFGYIIGFTLCALITGFLARFNTRGSFIIAYIIMLAGLAGIYTPGVLWLITILHHVAGVPRDIASLMKIGLVIPLIGDLITTLPAVLVSVRLRKILS